MAIDTIAKQMAELDIFRGLDETALDALARVADRAVYRPGHVIVEAGSDAGAAIMIVAGEAQIMADAERGITDSVLATGTLIGELGMLCEHRFMITVIAQSSVRAIALSRQAVHALMADNPAILAHFEARLVDRLSKVALELKLIDERLAAAASADLTTPSEPDTAVAG